jgi:hypothetical protein
MLKQKSVAARVALAVISITFGTLGAGCGDAAPTSPCGAEKGACIALVVGSNLSLTVDALRIYAFGGVRVSRHKPAAPLPVGEGIVAPMGVSGDQVITIEALRDDQPVGVGKTTVNVGTGQTSGSLTLTEFVAGVCPDGYLDCANGAADGCESFVATDPEHCGGCTQSCSFANAAAACNASVCAVGTCTTPWADCDTKPDNGCEANLLADPGHCGDCATACRLGEVCSDRRCRSNVVNCTSAGAQCSNSVCSSGRFAVSSGIAIDTGVSGGRRLWTRAVMTAANYAAATSACAALDLENVSGWRLPSYDELATLLQNPAVGCATCNPAIDQAAFPGTPAKDVEWTSSLAAAGSYYVVDFCAGQKTSAKDIDAHSFRCTHDALMQ